MPKATLYVCATPIGHLGDCSDRLVETLRSVDRIAAEDTRHSQRLLKRFDIVKPLVSLEKYNEKKRVATVLNWLSEGESIALVSDAGTPTVSDPGAVLVAAVREAGFSVVPIPGPSALATLLSVSGVQSDRFAFIGFLPRKASEWLTLYKQFSELPLPVVFYESPNRLIKRLSDLTSVDPHAYVVLGKEMTKQFETFYAGELVPVLSELDQASPLKGEWCGILVPTVVTPKSTDSLESDVAACREMGLTDQQIKKTLTIFRDHRPNDIKRFLFR